ncbi:MAG: tetratricopeptide repeat protein [Desulfuromonadales bacterium]|jgi:tetratricopeptide (TPR) repeat protein
MRLRAGKYLLAAGLLAAATAWTLPALSAEPAAAGSTPAAAAAVGSAPATADQPPATAPDWETLTRQGYRQLGVGDLDGAMASFEEALKQQPLAHAAKTGKGAVLARKGNLKDAERVLKEALILNPDPVRTYYELGRVYQQLGDFDRAVAEFKAGLEKYREGRK